MTHTKPEYQQVFLSLSGGTYVQTNLTFSAADARPRLDLGLSRSERARGDILADGYRQPRAHSCGDPSLSCRITGNVDFRHLRDHQSSVFRRRESDRLHRPELQH